MLLYSLSAHTQSYNTDYQPERNYRPEKEEIEVIANRFEARADAFDGKGKKSKNYVKDIWKAKAEYCKDLDSVKLLMRNDAISNYVSKLTERIKQYNPELKAIDTKILLYRTEVPNAASHGEGLFLVHLGLIERARTEAELAFILCHELAHEYKKHVVQNINLRAEQLYNKDFQKDLKKADAQEYNSYKTSVALLATFQSKLMNHNRKEELEADSLGLIYFVNAGYHPDGAISAMQMLDSLDYPIFDEKINYTKYFQNGNKPFDESLLRSDGSFIDLGYTIDSTYKIPDSLKTHPDCKLRISALQRISSAFPAGKVKVTPATMNYE
ncbi:MAG: M48 family metallopeptidase, partial [Bacteroidia bacterium]